MMNEKKKKRNIAKVKLRINPPKAYTYLFDSTRKKDVEMGKEKGNFICCRHVIQVQIVLSVVSVSNYLFSLSIYPFQSSA